MSRRTNSNTFAPDAPTQMPPRDANGFELDEWGLPTCGPERLVRLEAMGRADPLDDPTGWDAAAAPASPEPPASTATAEKAASKPVSTELNNG